MTAALAPSARRPLLAVSVLSVAVLLGACRGTGNTTSTPADSSAPVASSSPTASMTPSASSQPSASATDNLGAFACEFPVRGAATVDRAQLVDVRVGTHAGYDRVVFEFDKGLPAFTLKRATPPLLEDASGRELEVDGHAFWRLVMRPASRTDLDGNTSFTRTDFHPSFTRLTELVEGGDFEEVSTWYFGLDAQSCVRVLKLNHPARLVFDIEH